MIKRLITPETKALSRGDKTLSHRQLQGLVIESAEGIRWYGSSMPMPGNFGKVALSEVVDEETLPPEPPEVIE